MRRLAFTLPLLLTLFAALACQSETPAETAAADPTVPPDDPPPIASDGTVPASDGVPLAYTVTGGGPLAVVLIHGWSCDRSYWSEQVPLLADDYRVVALDLGGHGASGVEREEWTVDALGGDVVAVADALGLERMILVGHSLGGPVALAAAQAMPGRVVAVVGVDTFHDAGERPDAEQWGTLLRQLEADFTGTCASFIRSMFPEGSETDLVDRTVLHTCDATPKVAVPLLRDLGSYDEAAAMAAVDVPIRSINAAGYPTNVEGNRRFSPGYDAIVMDEVGHFLMLERPVDFNRHLLKLLEELTGQEEPAAHSG